MQDGRKYAKYFIEDFVDPQGQTLPGGPESAGGMNVLMINNEAGGAVPNATYINAEIVAKPTKPGPFQQHAHGFDEYIQVLGTNMDDPYRLDGLVEFWMEDEKYLLTRSCVIFVPTGVYHGPFVFHRVDSPIVWIESAGVTHYSYGMY